MEGAGQGGRGAYSVSLVLQDASTRSAGHAEGNSYLMAGKNDPIALGLGTLGLFTGAHVNKRKTTRAASGIRGNLGNKNGEGDEGTRGKL